VIVTSADIDRMAQRLLDEAALCANDGAHDIERLLDEARHLLRDTWQNVVELESKLARKALRELHQMDQEFNK
jgi:ABC-type transporter Mla subunit MlaD